MVYGRIQPLKGQDLGLLRGLFEANAQGVQTCCSLVMTKLLVMQR